MFTACYQKSTRDISMWFWSMQLSIIVKACKWQPLLIRQHLQIPIPPVVIPAPLVKKLSSQSQCCNFIVQKYFLPDVIIWKGIIIILYNFMGNKKVYNIIYYIIIIIYINAWFIIFWRGVLQQILECNTELVLCKQDQGGSFQQHIQGGLNILLKSFSISLFVVNFANAVLAA